MIGDKRLLTSLPPKRFPTSARPYVGQFLETTTSFALYSIVLYLSGIITGAYFLPLNHHHHTVPFHHLITPRDRANWNQYNNFGSAWGEGLATSATARTGGITDSFW